MYGYNQYKNEYTDIKDRASDFKEIHEKRY